MTTHNERTRFLYLLYQNADGNTNASYKVQELGKELGLDSNQISKIVNYLSEEKLLEILGVGAKDVAITHQGIKRIEEAIANQPPPTNPVGFGN